MGFPRGSMVKSLPANAGDTGLIPRSGRSPGGGNGNLLQYSCLKNPMDRGAWRATVHGVTKSWTRLSDWPPPREWLQRVSSRREPSQACAPGAGRGGENGQKPTRGTTWGGWDGAGVSGQGDHHAAPWFSHKVGRGGDGEDGSVPGTFSARAAACLPVLQQERSGW